jgi:hypothetical protein
VKRKRRIQIMKNNSRKVLIVSFLIPNLALAIRHTTHNSSIVLTEQELQSIYGGNIFTSIWNWIKKHFSVHVDRDAQMEPH